MLREISTVGRVAVLSTALTLAVSACGIKGPLKLPPAAPAAPAPSAPAAAPATATAPDAPAAPQPTPDESIPGKKP